MFASRLNYQFKPSVSWHPDPQAWPINAFCIDWSKLFLNAFPPFSVISQVLQKVEMAQARTILIVLNWPTQSWYLRLARLIIHRPILLPKNKSNVSLPSNQAKEHPLKGRLRLIACLLSGDHSQVMAF